VAGLAGDFVGLAGRPRLAEEPDEVSMSTHDADDLDGVWFGPVNDHVTVDGPASEWLVYQIFAWLESHNWLKEARFHGD
jgi:hypothetical protein